MFYSFCVPDGTSGPLEAEEQVVVSVKDCSDIGDLTIARPGSNADMKFTNDDVTYEDYLECDKQLPENFDMKEDYLRSNRLFGVKFEIQL